MKKNILILLTGLLLIFGMNAWAKSAIRDPKPVEKPMQAAFQGAHLEYAEGKLQGWARVDRDFSSLNKLHGYGNQVETILSPVSVFERKEISDSGFHSLELTGEIKEGVRAEIVFQSLPEGAEGKETYLIVNIVDTCGPETIDWAEEKMAAVFDIFGQNPEMNRMFAGYIPGKLSNRECNSRIKKAFQAAGGKAGGGIENDQFVSKTGYVVNLPGTMEVSGRRINMQIAASYNEINNRTYFYIGSPMVLSDY